MDDLCITPRRARPGSAIGQSRSAYAKVLLLDDLKTLVHCCFGVNAEAPDAA
jgi:hypothetical protein